MNKIYFLSDYHFDCGTIVGEGWRNYKIKIPGGAGLAEQVKYVPKEKCAKPDEEICVVWETWKGKNGRGTYRIEREMYPRLSLPADMVSYSSMGHGRVTEKEYGILQ